MTRVVEAGAPKTSSHSELTTPLFLNLQKRIARHAAAAKSLQLNLAHLLLLLLALKTSSLHPNIVYWCPCLSILQHIFIFRVSGLLPEGGL